MYVCVCVCPNACAHMRLCALPGVCSTYTSQPLPDTRANVFVNVCMCTREREGGERGGREGGGGREGERERKREREREREKQTDRDRDRQRDRHRERQRESARK